LDNHKVIDGQFATKRVSQEGQEQEWIAQAKQGSQQAFFHLYEKHH